MLTDAEINTFARTKCDLIDRSGNKCSIERDKLGKICIKYYDIIHYEEFYFNDFECEHVYNNSAQENDTDNLKTWLTTEWRRFMVLKAKYDPRFADYLDDLNVYLSKQDVAKK